MRQASVGADLGATSVRVVAVDGMDEYGYARVVRASSVRLPEGAIIAGEVKQPVVVAKALGAALAEARAPRRGVVLGLGVRNVAINQLTSPTAVKPPEREQVIRMARQEISPTVPLADSSLSLNTIRTDTTGEGRDFNILNVAAALRSDIASLTNVCKLAGVSPRAIDLSAAALMRALVRVGTSDTDIATVVDIGATKTTVATREGSWLRSVRIFPIGGQNLTRMLMTALDVSFEEAENRKFFLRLPGTADRASLEPSNSYTETSSDVDTTATTSAEDVLGKAAEQLIEEIAKSVAADARDHGSRPPRGMYLTGGGSRMRGLIDRLTDRVGIPVAAMAPWATLELSRKGLNSPDEDSLPLFTTAIGLALWRPPT